MRSVISLPCVLRKHQSSSKRSVKYTALLHKASYSGGFVFFKLQDLAPGGCICLKYDLCVKGALPGYNSIL